MKISIHELAEKELIDSCDFYDEQVFGLGLKFISDVETTIKLIAINPLAFPIYFKDYRRAILRKFPFTLIYKIEQETILIMAIAHQKRKPKYFVKRI